MDDGTLAVGDHFILDYHLDDDGALEVHIVPTDPGQAQFWVTVPTAGEPSYTRYLPASPRATEVAQALVDSGDLDKGYVDQVLATEQDQLREAKRQRIAELESELKQLQE